jgi:hypothetical protein
MRITIIIATLLSLFSCSSSTKTDGQDKDCGVFIKNCDQDAGILEDTTLLIENSFVLKNMSNDTCRILEIQKSCGCTEVDCNKNTLAPGSEAVIKVRINVEGLYGDIYKTITVYTSLTDNPLTASVTAFRKMPKYMQEKQFPFTVGEGIRISSKRAIIGNVKHGESKSQSISIINVSNKTIKISGNLLGDNDNLFDFFVPEELQPNEVSRIVITCDAEDVTEIYGERNCTLRLNDGKNNVSIDVFSIIIDNTKKSKLGNPRIQSLFKKKEISQDCSHLTFKYEIKNLGSKELIIKDIQLPDGVISSFRKETIKQQETKILEIRVSKRKASQNSFIDIGISSNDPIEPYKLIRLNVE